MTSAAPLELRWLWYACRTSHCIAVDREAYPITMYDGRPYPWPSWACKAPDGGIHPSASAASIDIKVTHKPRGRQEFQWTCDFAVFVLHRGWFDQIQDLADRNRIAVGRLILRGQPLDDWITIQGRRPPIMRSTQGSEKTCPICGNPNTLYRGRPFFTDPAVQDMPLIVNNRGIFVREDEVIRRNLRPPIGAFKPSLVPLKRGRSAEPTYGNLD